MPQLSKIEWTDYTWNPVTGCRKISPACKNCYAERIAERFRGVADHPYQQGFDIKLWPERLNIPLRWRRPGRIFVNSMSDLFLEEVPGAFIEGVIRTMEKAKWHRFQVLTKRPKRMVKWISDWIDKKNDWPGNVWLGVSIENQDYMWRIEYLRQTPATVRFVSFEPLLDRIKLKSNSLEGIQWVILGGESGENARPMRRGWVEEIHSAAKKADVLFFFKQWGTYNEAGLKVGKKNAGRVFKGRIWDEIPS